MRNQNKSIGEKEMEVREVFRLYQHTDGEGTVTYDPATFTLRVINSVSWEEASVLIGPRGLLSVAEEMIRIADEMLCQEEDDE
mgnify:CR=1 FL=1